MDRSNSSQPHRGSIRDYLAKEVDIFADLSDAEIERLTSTAELKTYKAGDLIVEQDTPGHSALVLKYGAADTILKTPSGTTVPLSKINPGELFGEMALFDENEIRTASVIAAEDGTEVIAIHRDGFQEEIARHPKISMKLMAVIAKRLRRSDKVVSDFSERIYGDVLPRVERAVLGQLDSAKALCELSKDRLAACEERSHRILNEATEQVQGQWKALRRTGMLALGLLSLVGSAATWFGISSYKDWTNTVHNTKTVAANAIKKTETAAEKAEEIVDELSTDVQFLRWRKSRTAFEDLFINKLRQDLQLGSVDSAAVKEVDDDAAKDFIAAYSRLNKELLSQPGKWQSATLTRALDLIYQMRKKGYIRFDKQLWRNVLAAIDASIGNPPAASQWRERQRFQEVAAGLYRIVVKDYPDGQLELTKRIERLLKDDTTSPDTAEQAALLLARVGRNTSTVIRALMKFQADENPWRRSNAAISLLSLDEKSGWRTLRVDLAKGWAALHQVVDDQNTYAVSDESGGLKKDKMASFAAAFRLAETLSLASDENGIDVDHLQEQLGPTKFFVNGSNRHDQAFGVDLIAEIMFRFIEQSDAETLDNRIFWQSSCNRICSLGCEIPGSTDGGKWCRACNIELTKRFLSWSEQYNQPVMSCSAGSGAAYAAERTIR